MLPKLGTGNETAATATRCESGAQGETEAGQADADGPWGGPSLWPCALLASSYTALLSQLLKLTRRAGSTERALPVAWAGSGSWEEKESKNIYDVNCC